MADMSLPPWLIPKTAPWEALVAGVQAGVAIKANMLRAQQIAAEAAASIQREQTNAQLRLMDMALEKDRNDIATRSFNLKAETDKAKAEGMLAIGQYVYEGIKNGKLLDPEYQAGYWNLVAIHPQVEQPVVNSIWDNTFKPAMDRKARADELEKGKSTAFIANAEYVRQAEADFLKAAAENKSDEEVESKLRHLRRVEVMGRIMPEGEPIANEVPDSSGRLYTIFKLPNGRFQIYPQPDPSKIEPIDKDRYNKEMSAIQRRWEDPLDRTFRKPIALPDGTTRWVRDEALRKAAEDEAYNKARKMKPATGATSDNLKPTPGLKADFQFIPPK
jgi:predicted CopG family antitoxin